MGIFNKHFRGTDPIQPIVRTLGMIGKLKLEGLKTLANMENEKELSGKKEFKVGEVFQCGLVKLRCEESQEIRKCFKCFFCDKYLYDCDVDYSIKGEMGCFCNAGDREDRTDVIFVKVEE